MKVSVVVIGLATLVATVGCEEEREHHQSPAGGAYEGYDHGYGRGYGQGGYSPDNSLNQTAPRNYQGYTSPNPYPFH